MAPFSDKIDFVGLFGSHATGKARENSDIDLVVYGTLNDYEVDRLWSLFDASALSVPVDVIAYNLPIYPPLKAHIDRVMQPLFQKSDLICRSPALDAYVAGL